MEGTAPLVIGSWGEARRWNRAEWLAGMSWSAFFLQPVLVCSTWSPKPCSNLQCLLEADGGVVGLDLPLPQGRHFVLSPQLRIRLSLCVSAYTSPQKWCLSVVLIKPKHLKGCTVLCVCCMTISFVWVRGKGWSAHLLCLIFSIFQYCDLSSVIPVECYLQMFGLK